MRFLSLLAASLATLSSASCAPAAKVAYTLKVRTGTEATYISPTYNVQGNYVHAIPISTYTDLSKFKYGDYVVEFTTYASASKFTIDADGYLKALIKTDGVLTEYYLVWESGYLIPKTSYSSADALVLKCSISAGIMSCNRYPQVTLYTHTTTYKLLGTSTDSKANGAFTFETFTTTYS